MTQANENPKHAFGNAKPGLSTTPAGSVLKAGIVHDLGAKKYGAFNWRESGVVASVYYNAAQRHLMSWFEGEEIDPESGQSHLAHVVACMNILMDCEELKLLEDDRPRRGSAFGIIKRGTKEIDHDLELISKGSSMSAEDIQRKGDTI